MANYTQNLPLRVFSGVEFDGKISFLISHQKSWNNLNFSFGAHVSSYFDPQRQLCLPTIATLCRPHTPKKKSDKKLSKTITYVEKVALDETSMHDALSEKSPNLGVT